MPDALSGLLFFADNPLLILLNFLKVLLNFLGYQTDLDNNQESHSPSLIS